MRRGHVRHYYLAQEEQALADLAPALAALRAAGDRVWEARTLNIIGGCRLALGQVGEAEAAIREAEAIFTDEGQRLEALITLHNRGSIAFRQATCPGRCALRPGGRGVRRAGHGRGQAGGGAASSPADAGLAREAVDLVRSRVDAGSVPAVELAELVLVRAGAELAADDPVASLRSATEARTLIRRQGRDRDALDAELAVLRARYRSGSLVPAMVSLSAEVAAGLEAARSDDAAAAWLLAGRTALDLGSAAAPELLERASRFRKRRTDSVRATAWHASALARDAQADGRGVLSACRRGLDALDDHRATLGSSELRALATRRGDELALLALRHAERRGPRALLEWSERWRATALSQPPVHPPDDAELAQGLAALRETGAAWPKPRRTGRRSPRAWRRTALASSGPSGVARTIWGRGGRRHPLRRRTAGRLPTGHHLRRARRHRWRTPRAGGVPRARDPPRGG